MQLRIFRGVLNVVFAATASLAAIAAEAGHDREGTVYTMSNAAEGNEVLAFTHARDGSLVPAGSYDTGGRGAGRGLGNQGALASNGDYIFVVNPGSDDLSSLRVTRSGLRLVDTIASGGVRPISVTVHRNLVYVLNTGSDSIAGFTVGRDGVLNVLPGSEQSLSGTGADPAQIQFSEDGRTLIVTEKATNNIVLYSLTHRGLPEARTIVPSLGQTPFGFAVSKRNEVIVSEAAGGAANASSVSSYRLGRDGDLRVADATDATGQTAACWVAVTADGRFAYVSNTGSGTVTAFRILAGRLILLNRNGVAATSGNTPIDVTLSADGRTLHVLNAGDHTIASFRILHDGGLRALDVSRGLPAAASGLLAL